MLAAALMEEEETDEDEADDVDEGIELHNKLKAAGLVSTDKQTMS